MKATRFETVCFLMRMVTLGWLISDLDQWALKIVLVWLVLTAEAMAFVLRYYVDTLKRLVK